ncbi:MAG: hypothetical protein ACOCM8_07415, partial [Acetivibrio ethanolgignens]
SFAGLRPAPHFFGLRRAANSKIIDFLVRRASPYKNRQLQSRLRAAGLLLPIFARLMLYTHIIH